MRSSMRNCGVAEEAEEISSEDSRRKEDATVIHINSHN
jgi:hypothetical protein